MGIKIGGDGEGNYTRRDYVSINGKTGEMVLSIRPANKGDKWGKEVHPPQGFRGARVEGNVLGFYTEQGHYQGAARASAVVVIGSKEEDRDVQTHVAFTVWTQAGGVSSTGLKGLSRLAAADPNQPVTLCANYTPAGAKMGTAADAPISQANFVSIMVGQGRGSLQPLIELPKLERRINPISKQEETVGKDAAYMPLLEQLTAMLSERYPFDPEARDADAPAPHGEPEDEAFDPNAVVDAAGGDRQRVAA